MYTETDVLDLSKQLKRRVLAWLAPETLLLAAMIISFIIRIEWLSSLLFAILCGMVLFSLSMMILPVSRYRAFLRNALTGHTTRSVAEFLSFSEDIMVREGVRLIPITMRVDSVKEELDKRQYYWDANLPKPEWKTGDRIALRSYERQVVSWEKAANDAPLED